MNFLKKHIEEILKEYDRMSMDDLKEIRGHTNACILNKDPYPTALRSCDFVNKIDAEWTIGVAKPKNPYGYMTIKMMSQDKGIFPVDYKINIERTGYYHSYLDIIIMAFADFKKEWEASCSHFAELSIDKLVKSIDLLIYESVGGKNV